ncbi:MAG TPA: CotH kinase family protein [Planctomycetota bacterium]
MLSTMVRIQCPKCRAAYQVGADRAGKSVRCRKCAQSWIVGEPAAPEPAKSEPAVEKPRRTSKVSAPAVAKAPARPSRRPLLAAAIALVVLAGLGVWALTRSPKAATAPAAPAPAQAAKPQAPPPKPAAPPAPAPPAPKKPAVDPNALAADAFFKTPKVVELSLEIAPGDYEALKREPRKYVRATLKEGDKTWKNVAVHLKGAAGSFRGIDDKAGFSINMDKFTDDQSFHGLDKFHLNNSVQDPSFVSELISGEIFRGAGVPASRCAHAILAVNGKPKGFYVLKEGYDVAFLERNFGTKKGNLYDGGFLRELDQPLQVISQKDDVAPYSELKSLWNAAQLPDPATRFKELERLLDGDRWVSYLAIEALMFDWDGYPMNRNNYRLYHDPKRDKIVFIPSGTDQMFADPNGTLLPNYNGFLAKAYITTPDGRLRYLNRLDEILKTCWKVEDWNKRLDEVEAVIKPALAKVDAGHANGLPGHIGRLRAAFAHRKQTAPTQLRRLLNPTPPKTVAGGPGLPDDGFLRKYLFLGPVSVQGTPGPQALQKDWLNGEAGLKPAAGTKTGALAWKPFEALDGMVDFHAASGKQADFSAGYLVAYLVCEKDFKDLHLKMGSDDQGKVWINGKEVLKYEGDRGAAPDQDTAPNIALNKGVNTILFKVVNGAGGFNGILRFTLPDGSAFMDARLSLNPDGK